MTLRIGREGNINYRIRQANICAGISRRQLVKALVSEATRQRLSRGRCSWVVRLVPFLPRGQKCVNVSSMKDECPAVVLISRPHRGYPVLPSLRAFLPSASLVSAVISPTWILQVLVNVKGRSSAARPR